MRFGFNLALAAALAAVLLVVPGLALAQHEQPAPAAAAQARGGHTAAATPAAAGEHAAAGDAAEGGHEEANPIVSIIARLFNFAILAGTLVYFLKSPLAGYLRDRSAGIRSDLSKAAVMRSQAAVQLAEIDQKMAALPRELDALRKAGAEEVAAEEARIREVAAAERARLLDQARREIDWQLSIAKRDLTARTADLAVAIAARRVQATITPEDQARLVDRYLSQLRSAPAAGKQVSA
jgi:F-type H+-transporting ATPase subunit b